ncbi:MAG: hypothetical protein A2514_15885 [Gammaproteobacteria bacterium RIFOXYD12_FULL_61_37]|nr:MAG: hypothetical protein A2514_15885 [Gammaproteobacteria bacterium RIFOXYD12_FULL_61_37]
MHKTLLCAALTLAASTVSAEAYFTVGTGVEHFEWTEYFQGERLLKESGERGVLKAKFEGNQGGFVYGTSGKLYSGAVNYDGSTQAGVPVQTETDYNGYQAETTLGWRFPLSVIEDGEQSLDLLAGIGLDHWERDIKDGRDALGNAAQGYVEKYDVPYAKLGAAWLVTDGDWNHKMSAGVKRPLEVKENVPEFGANIRPEPKNTLYIAYDMTEATSGLGLSAWYENGKFGESLVTTSSLGSVFQPESRFEAIGVGVTYTF